MVFNIMLVVDCTKLSANGGGQVGVELYYKWILDWIVYTHIHTYIHTHTHTLIHTHVHTVTHTYIHITHLCMITTSY